MAKRRIHVNKHRVKAGHPNPIGVEMYDTKIYCDEVSMPDGCRVVYRPSKPLRCGAKLWIETDGRVDFGNGWVLE